MKFFKKDNFPKLVITQVLEGKETVLTRGKFTKEKSRVSLTLSKPTKNFQIIFNGIVAVPTAEIIEDKYFEFISKYKILDYNEYLMNYKKV